PRPWGSRSRPHLADAALECVRRGALEQGGGPGQRLGHTAGGIGHRSALSQALRHLLLVGARGPLRLESEGQAREARRSRGAMRAEPLSADPRALRMIAIAPRDLALLVGITFIWGLNIILSKIGVTHIPPILFTFLRFAILAVILVPLLRVRAGQMSALVVAALLSGGLHFALSFAGLRLAENVSSVAIAGQLGVPITTLLSVALLGEVVRWRRWTGILLAF